VTTVNVGGGEVKFDGIKEYSHGINLR
jgi:hypothetical protein